MGRLRLVTGVAAGVLVLRHLFLLLGVLVVRAFPPPPPPPGVTQLLHPHHEWLLAALGLAVAVATRVAADLLAPPWSAPDGLVWSVLGVVCVVAAGLMVRARLRERPGR